MNPYITRRALMKFGLATGALLPLAKVLVGRSAFGAGEQLDPNDPTAKALGYVTKSIKPDAQCGNCAQFQGNSKDATGPCTIFAGKSVASSGWCSAWVKKTA